MNSIFKKGVQAFGVMFLLIVSSSFADVEAEAKDKKAAADTHHKDETGHGHEEGEHEEEAPARVGPDQAITAANREEGLQLSPKATLALGLKMQAISREKNHKIPKNAVVYSQDEIGVYRFRRGWFKLVDVQVLTKTASEATIQSDDLTASDQIVIAGVGLLRVADLEAWGGSGDGHGH